MFTDRDAERLRSIRVRQPWPSGRPFKILSLDGGGIRGLFSAKVIEEIEKTLGLQHPIGSYFDLIAGTSTGGIIAIGLGFGTPSSRISSLYEVRGEKIFPPFWSRVRILRALRQFRRSLYNHGQLEKALQDEFRNRTFGASAARLVVPAFVGPSAQVAVFKTDHHPDYRRDWRTPAWEVARATSAAPTFFEGHRYGSSYFLDGGVWANNPIMLAVVEAVSAYEIGLDQIEVLSIGTGNQQPRFRRSAVRAGLFGWRDVIKAAMYLTTDTALSQAQLLLGWESVVRVQPSSEGAALELDDWRGAIELLPKDASAQVARTAAHLTRFFERPAYPRERHYSSAEVS